jgi:hypothetical protein
MVLSVLCASPARVAATQPDGPGRARAADGPSHRARQRASSPTSVPTRPEGHASGSTPLDPSAAVVAQLLWWARLDRRYRVEALRAGPTSARLRVVDREAGDRTLLDEEVELIAGAEYGPDVADVAAWQARVIELVDGAKQKEAS